MDVDEIIYPGSIADYLAKEPRPLRRKASSTNVEHGQSSRKSPRQGDEDEEMRDA
jgi:hypothetical protein